SSCSRSPRAILFCLTRPPPTPPLFPYTTLFRSHPYRELTLLRESMNGFDDECPVERRAESTTTGEAKWDARISGITGIPHDVQRSEEHTSELQSPDQLVCRLLLVKKQTTKSNAT